MRFGEMGANLEMAHRACIALGANLGAREGTLARAVKLLRGRTDVRVLAVSKFIDTAAVGGPDGQPEYLNGAAVLETSLSPRELLNVLLEMERELGRVRSSPERNTPRVVDLDVLLYEDVVMNEAGLELPHPRMHERLFVLQPLCDVAPEWVHPILKKRMSELLDGVQ